MEFTERLDVRLNDREFTCEATPTEVLVGITDGEDVFQTRYTARIFENGVVANAGNMPKFDTIEDAIQYGFQWCKEAVK
jgi:hypothetical protein